MLSGSVPASLAMLPDLTTIALSPGNYQLCGAKPPSARFTLCRQVDTSFCAPNTLLASTCQPSLPANRLMMPKASLQATGLQVRMAPCCARLDLVLAMRGSRPAGGTSHSGPHCVQQLSSGEHSSGGGAAAAASGQL